MQKSRSLMKLLGYATYDKVRRRLADDNGWLCSYCGGGVTIGFTAGFRLATIDHKIPVSRGGTHKRYNLACACKSCNEAKGSMTVEEFLRSQLANVANAADVYLEGCPSIAARS